MDDLVDQEGVAELFDVSTRTIRNWVSRGELLEPIKIGRKQFWLKSMIQEWLAARSPRNGARQVASVKKGRPRLPV